jgi:Ca2+-binding EF-hand superfamily protein
MKIKIIKTLAAAALLTGSLGVTQAEEAKATDAKPAKAKAAKKSDRATPRAAIIKRFDKDGDGKLNEAERKAAGAFRKAQGARQSDRVSDKARPNSGLRERYAATAKKIREAIKAGKMTEAQGKEKLAAYRKKMGQSRGDSVRSRQTREELMKRYDKNGDGKLDEGERAALRKVMSDRYSGKRRPGGDDKNAKRKRPGQGNDKNAERKRRGGDRGKRGEGKRRGKRREKK